MVTRRSLLGLLSSVPLLSALAPRASSGESSRAVYPSAGTVGESHCSLPDWTPTASQQAALLSKADIVLFGGAAGGGATTLLGALPRYENGTGLALIRSPFNGEDFSIPCRQVFGAREDYDMQAGPSLVYQNGTRVVLGYDPEPGMEYDFLLVDNAADFTPGEVESALRKVKPGGRVIMTVRPPLTRSPDGEWLRQLMLRWSFPYLQPGRAKQGEVVNFRLFGYLGMSVTFIKSTIEDNPYLSRGYRDALSQLPEPARSALRDGVWS